MGQACCWINAMSKFGQVLDQRHRPKHRFFTWKNRKTYKKRENLIALFWNIMTGWCFGTFFSPSIGNFIIPTDELHHFSEGSGWNHQPDDLHPMISPLYHHDITSHITVPPKVLCCFEERSFQLTARRGGSFLGSEGRKWWLIDQPCLNMILTMY